MFKKIVPLNPQTHADKRLLPVDSYQFAQNTYLASLVISEFTLAASVYPIVFVKNGTHYAPFALFGLKEGENLFVNEKGEWDANYIPAIIRRYPFILGRTEGEEELRLCIDEGSEFFSDHEGKPLFDADGNPTDVIENARKYLSELHRLNTLTDRFTQELIAHDLLALLNIQIKDDEGNTQNIDGCFGVNEKKFHDMSDEHFLEFRQNGILPLIYAHLLSLAQIGKIARLRYK